MLKTNGDFPPTTEQQTIYPLTAHLAVKRHPTPIFTRDERSNPLSPLQLLCKLSKFPPGPSPTNLMEVSQTVANWLEEVRILEEVTYGSSGAPMLPKDKAAGFASGQLFAVLIAVLLQVTGGKQSTDTLKGLRRGGLASDRLYNWKSQVGPLLRQLGVALDNDTLAQLVAGGK